MVLIAVPDSTIKSSALTDLNGNYTFTNVAEGSYVVKAQIVGYSPNFSSRFASTPNTKVADIPMDYNGLMGVPITFIDKYNPEQFEILDINPHFFSIVEQGLPKPDQLHITGQKDPYARILTKHRRV